MCVVTSLHTMPPGAGANGNIAIGHIARGRANVKCNDASGFAQARLVASLVSFEDARRVASPGPSNLPRPSRALQQLGPSSILGRWGPGLRASEYLRWP
jgi:hypothetical protein